MDSLKPKQPANGLPPLPEVQKLPAFETPHGTGVPESYKQRANAGGNVMWRAKVKGRKSLSTGIPLHVSLKTFDKPEDLPIDEIHQKVKELNIQRPDPNKLKYEATTHQSPKTGLTYYMLKLHNHDPAHEAFNAHFNGRGITHPKFMQHITIDKELHDQIQKEGLRPDEISFSPLMIEQGANNPTHIFPDAQSHKDAEDDVTPKRLGPHQTLEKSEFMEPLEKSAMKRFGMAAAAMGALSGYPKVAQAPQPSAQQMSAQQANQYSSKRMLNAMRQVESSGGKDINHAKATNGQTAIGQYALMPDTIRDTVKMNPDLKRHHPRVLALQNKDMAHYLQDNPELEQQVAERHLSRLEHHFGHDPATLGYAWLNGVVGTNRDLKRGINPNTHWHAAKVVKAYNQGK